MPTLSKMVTDRSRSAQKVHAALTTHEPAMVTGFAAAFGEEAAGHLGHVVKAVARTLNQSKTAMEKADLRHAQELSDDTAPRDARDAASTTVHDQLVVTRSGLGAAFGEKFVGQLGFKGPTPDDPQAVLALGRLVLEQLPRLTPPRSTLPGFTYSVDAWTAPLTASLPHLEETLRTVATEDREAEGTLQEKRKATDQYDLTFSHAANFASTLLELAGQPELAARVRPSVSRPGQTVEDAGGAPIAAPPVPGTP